MLVTIIEVMLVVIIVMVVVFVKCCTTCGRATSRTDCTYIATHAITFNT